MSVVLQARGLCAGYHGHPVVHDVELELVSGRVTALLGSNGAGKTTTLLTLAGGLKPLLGSVVFDSRKTTAPLYRRARAGLALVTEERAVFMGLTVTENLRVARCDSERVLGLFPELRPLLRRRCGLLSGGEQQMLAVGRALASKPKALLVDELSLGLAPIIVQRLLDAVRRAADEDGIAVLLVEQHVAQALRVADEVNVLRRGRIVLTGPPSAVSDQIQDAYLSGLDENPAPMSRRRE